MCNIDDDVKKYIKIGILTRLLIVCVLFKFSLEIKLKIILIFATDFIDCIISKLLLYLNDGCNNLTKVCHTFTYQILDKCADSLTYLMLAIYMKLEMRFLLVILFRIIGVFLFYKDLDSKWLIAFPDVFKELLLYKFYIDELNIQNVSVIFILKTIFEFFWHTYQNKNIYSTC